MSSLGDLLAERAIERAAEHADDVFLAEMEALLARGGSEVAISEALTGRRPYWADVWKGWLELKNAGQPQVSDPPGTVQA